MGEAVRDRGIGPTYAFSPLLAGVIPGVVFAFRINAEGVATELPADGPIDVDGEASTWLWLHMNLADKRACAWINACNALPAAARALVVGQHDHQQLYTTKDCVFGVFADLVRSLDRALDETGYLTFAMTGRLVVTGRRAALQAAEAMRQGLLSGRRVTNSATLVEAIVEQAAIGIDALLGNLGRELDAIEDLVLIDAVADERRRLGRVRRTTVHLHRQLAGLRTLLNRFEISDEIAETAAIALNTDRLAQRLDGLDQEVVSLQERARLLQEEIGSRLSEETALHLNTLSVLTALLLPATLITGIFGMNTSDLPFTQSAHGSFWAITIGAIVALGAYWMLRVMGVIKRRSPGGRHL